MASSVSRFTPVSVLHIHRVFRRVVDIALFRYGLLLSFAVPISMPVLVISVLPYCVWLCVHVSSLRYCNTLAETYSSSRSSCAA